MRTGAVTLLFAAMLDGCAAPTAPRHPVSPTPLLCSGLSEGSIAAQLARFGEVPRVMDPYRTLRETDVFPQDALLGGIAPAPSPVAIAFRELLREPDAPSKLRRLTHEAHRLEGQLVALCGLAFTDRAEHDRLLPRFVHLERIVSTTHVGCVQGDAFVDDLLGADPVERARRIELFVLPADRLRALRAEDRTRRPHEPLPLDDRRESSARRR